MTSTTIPTPSLAVPAKPDGIDLRAAAGTLTPDDERWLGHQAARAEDAMQQRVLESLERKVALMRRARGDNHQTSLLAPTADHLSAFSVGTVSASALLAEDIPPLSWLVEGMIPRGGLGVLLASEKTGKSLFALDCGEAVATGRPFLDRETTQANVLIIEQEGARSALQGRIRRMMHCDPPANLHLRHRERTDLTDPELLAGLQAFIVEHEIGLVFVGPLAQTGNLEDENSAVAFTQIVKNILDLISATGVTIALIHHRKKPSQGDSYAAVSAFFNTSRGSTALMAAVDFGIGLQRAQEDAHGKIFVLLRDAASSIGFYTFDTDTLRIAATTEILVSKAEQHASALVAYLIENTAPLSRAGLETALGMNRKALERALKAGVESDRIEMLGSGNRVTYQLAPALRARMDRDPKADSGLLSLASEAA